MAKFSIRSLLGFVAVTCVFLIALANPNKLWADIISMGAMIVLVLLLPIIIGAQGKLRLQILSFAILCIGSLYISQQYPRSNFMKAQSGVIESLDNLLCTSRKPTPTGEEVLVYQGEYFQYQVPGEAWKDTTKAEIKKRGWDRYVVAAKTGISRQHFKTICETFIALMFGLMGFLITGWAYDKREPSADSQ